jgi:dihydroorotate dehydrogenase
MEKLDHSQHADPSEYAIQARPEAGEGDIEAIGLRFRNPLGLAAGVDQDGSRLAESAACGFGFLEIGTIRPDAMPAEAMLRAADRIVAFRREVPGVPVGVSLGSSAAGLDRQTLLDLAQSLRAFWPVADYLVLNLSSERREDRRGIPTAMIERFLASLAKVAAGIAEESGRDVPLLPKLSLATDTAWLPAVRGADRLAGMIGVAEDVASMAEAAAAIAPKPLISIGGITTAAEAAHRLAAGARLVQIHRAFTRDGAAAVRAILQPPGFRP